MLEKVSRPQDYPATNCTAEDYQALYRRSLSDPDGFWREQSRRIDWERAPERIANWSFDPVDINWFEDGILNLCHNCVDRHLDSRADDIAILWEGDETGQVRRISYGELYMALQQGVVDGQENPLANIYTAKLYEVQKYISFTNHKYEPTGLIMSAIAWKRLDSAGQNAIRAAAKEATEYQRKASFDSEQKFLEEFKKMTSVELNEVDLAPFRKATESVWDSWEKKPFGDFVKRLRATRA